MSKSKWFWILIAIGGCSFALASKFAGEGFLTSFLAVPGVAAMIGLVIVIVRDDAAHHRSLELQNRQHVFGFVAAEHMATVAFNKHSEFCDEYMHVLLDGMSGIPFADKRMIELSQKLCGIRKKYLIWLTGDIEQKLKKIENAISSVGTDSYQLEFIGIGPERNKKVDEMMRKYLSLIGGGPTGDADAVISTTVNHTRKILGIDGLVRIRESSIGMILNTEKQTVE